MTSAESSCSLNHCLQSNRLSFISVLKKETRHTVDVSNAAGYEETSEVADGGRPRAHLQTSQSRDHPCLLSGHEAVQRPEPKTPKLVDHPGRQRRQRHLRREDDGRSASKSGTVGSRDSGRTGETNHPRLQPAGLRVPVGRQTWRLESQVRGDGPALRALDPDSAVPRTGDAGQLQEPDMCSLRRPEDLFEAVQLGGF